MAIGEKPTWRQWAQEKWRKSVETRTSTEGVETVTRGGQEDDDGAGTRQEKVYSGR